MMKKSKILLTMGISMLMLSTTILASTSKPVLKVNSTPVFEGGEITRQSARDTKVTDSNVNYEWSDNTPGFWVYAEGYVTVKDGSSDYYHYTRVQIKKNSSVHAKSSNEWGYGKVSAETGDVKHPGDDYEGHIYYGW